MSNHAYAIYNHYYTVMLIVSWVLKVIFIITIPINQAPGKPRSPLIHIPPGKPILFFLLYSAANLHSASVVIFVSPLRCDAEPDVNIL